jgi:Uncharacterized stress protein (general stress protein 26)
MISSTIEILQDKPLKELLWADGCEVYYPFVDDHDYTVLCFTLECGN